MSLEPLDKPNRAKSELWRDRAFVLYWAARNISILGSTVSAVVLPILIFQLTGSALQTSLVAALEVIPYLLFGLLAGALADRVDRRRLMVGSDLINAALLASIPLAALFNVLTLPHIYLVAFFSSVAFVWFDAANFGALPALVGRDKIVDANSNLTASSTIIGLVGPALGGALAAFFGAANAIWLDAASYLVSALLLAIVPRPFQSDGAAPAARVGSVVAKVGADIREGLEFLWHQHLVRALTFLGFGLSLTNGAVVGLLVVYAVRGLGLDDTDPRLGLLFSAGALGALAASLLLPRLTKRFKIGLITVVGLSASVVALLALIVSPDFVTALVAYTLWQATTLLVIINGISLRQIVTPDHLQSRVNATARMIAWGGTPFGAALGGILAEALPIRVALLLMGVGIGLSAVIGWLSSVRHADMERRLSVEQASVSS